GSPGISGGGGGSPYADSFKEFTNIDEARAWGDKQFAKYKLSSSEKNALTIYTRNAARINGPLRANQGNTNGLPADIRKEVEQIDKSFTKMQTPENIILFRGDDPGYLGPDFENTILNRDGTINKAVFEQVKLRFKGKDRKEYGYISTSLVNGSAFAGRPIITKFKVLDGSKAGYIEPISTFKGQLEVLLPRSSTYTISDMQIAPNNKQIIITALLKR
uniref:Mono-ADP-ribosyltransferase C3 n=1 Tax=Hathewaya limosa TaxID=1536 RepID=UPI000175465E|nr:Chain A, Mono-ADP-ribosyltransferase C3 [Hathewaya limosa]3BW8_B Chain B, Mono-ADP-ribosyltransferase C3 [Hathewaya limosa]